MCLMKRILTQSSGTTFRERNIWERDGVNVVMAGRLKLKEANMGFGRGALLWLLGVPLPIIILLALFMR